MISLETANKILRSGDLEAAEKAYKELMSYHPYLSDIIESNLKIINYKKNEEIGGGAVFSKPEKTAVVVHYYYYEAWCAIREKLCNLSGLFDLFITCPIEKVKEIAVDIKSYFPSARLFASDNKGMDIIPFISLTPILESEGYTSICKIHTKNNKDEINKTWFQVMLNSLIGSRDNFLNAKDKLSRDRCLSLIGPSSLYLSGKKLIYNNEQKIKSMVNEENHKKILDGDWGFFAGTMFWVSIDHASCVYKKIQCELNKTEAGYRVDGGLEHAAERLFGLYLYLNNKKVGLIHPRFINYDDSVIVVSSPSLGINCSHISDTLLETIKVKENIEVIKKSSLFDEAFYLEQNPHLSKQNISLEYHYLTVGTFSEKYPNKFFIPREYRELNPEIKEEPFCHYLRNGAFEGRRYRSTKAREENESPFFRYMAINSQLVDWEEQKEKKAKKDLVSIVIPIYGQKFLTQQCLDSILSAKNKLEYEVICMDNGSEPEIGELLEKYKSNKEIKYIRNDENYNFSVGCNVGFCHSVGDIVVFLNNDTTVTDYWLDELVSPLGNKENVAVQPKLLYPDLTIQNIGVVFADKQTLGYPIYAGFESDIEPAKVSRPYQAVTAACLGVRREDFIKVRGFDPVFINGQEDIDLCLKLTVGTNYNCWFQATSTVIHHESKTPGRGKYIPINRLNFVKKWKGKISPDDRKFYAKDKYKIVDWKKDIDAFRKKDIAVNVPVLEKTKVATVLFEWDFELEKKEKDQKISVYEKNKNIYSSLSASIIMPTFNRREIISQAIDSVLVQSHRSLELIICDDGSTDDTKKFIESKYSDSRIRFICLDHKGVSHARNQGLKFAKGEYIFFLDTDNAWDKDFLKIMIGSMESMNLDSAYSAIKALDDNGNTICYRGDDFYWDECLKDNYIDMNSFCHKNEGEVYFDESLKRLVDWDYILNVTKEKKVGFIPFIGVNYYDGNKNKRITRTEYQGDEVRKIQQLIRDKHKEGFDSFNDQKNNNSQSIFTQKPLSFRIKIGCPTMKISHEWGDYHFAVAMKQSLEKRGHICHIDCLDTWYQNEPYVSDVVIVLRGLSRYKPEKSQLNLMWNISHPDKITYEEYEQYDYVFIASELQCHNIKSKLNVDIMPLLQCTDSSRFNLNSIVRKSHRALFVGNSRNVYRPIVKDAVESGIPVSVYGTRWQQFIDKKYIFGEHINNEELAGYYSSAEIVLNDHWESMHKYGFISNRIFDASACGSLLVTDNILGLKNIFEDNVLVYSNKEELKEIFENRKEIRAQKNLKELSSLITSKHTFDARIGQIMHCIGIKNYS